MKHVRPLSLLAALFVMPQAFAQPQPGQPQPTIAIQRSPAIVREVPTPDSVVWRSFYDRFRSASEMQDFLVDNVGLTSSEAATVVNAGQQYLQQFSAIDDATATEIKARFQPAYLPPNLPQLLQNSGLAAPPQSATIGGRMADGRSVRDAIVADGLPVRVERQRDAALRAHHLQLRQTIGPQKFTALENWVSSKVAPSIKSFDVTPPAPATPVMPSTK